MPIAIVALVVTIACWKRVSGLRWRPDDGDDWRRGGEDSPLNPVDGPGGIVFDWDAFERDFRAYVAGLGRTGSRELILA